MTTPVLSANNITIRVGENFFFHKTSWQLHSGEQWLILGQNGSGKTTFAKALAGLLPLKQGEIILHTATDKPYQYTHLHKDKIVYMSFETQQKFITRDSLRRDYESYIGLEAPGALVSDYLGKDYNTHVFQATFGVHGLLNREIDTLSTGEMRKVFLVKALLGNPQILVLDEPFDGLDFATKRQLLEVVNEIMAMGTQVILITHRAEEIPQEITNIMLIKNCKILASGTKQEITQKYEKLFKEAVTKPLGVVAKDTTEENREVLISMNDVNVFYEQKQALSHITWEVKSGDNWVILGHNGAGKSTLLKLITGEELQHFANNIMLFGKERKKQALWDVKNEIGIVSTDLQLAHQYNLSAFSVVLSGFFDSIGLYSKVTPTQRKKAEELITELYLENLADKEYQQLSFGQKRLILIARALVKNPKILLLDEPCHGLDIENKKMVLKLIDEIGKSKKTTLLLITHNLDEIVDSITHVLELENGKIIKQGRLSS